MHLVLTDWLTCPNCGPGEGLIVLAERMEQRRVLDGTLGCPACQRQFPVRQGEADLRVGEPRAVLPGAPNADAGDAQRLAALLGITEGRGYALLLGHVTAQAAALAELVPGLELVAINARAQAVQAGVNRLLADAMLPLRDGSMRGVVLSEDAAPITHEEALRVLAPGARLVVSSALPAAAVLAGSARLRMLAHDAQHLVLTRVH
jgi:uncharacterized protein YbaR (Trm112 family)